MEGQGENEELYPIAVLIDELKVGKGSGLYRASDADVADL
jgi:hypothetical protein